MANNLEKQLKRLSRRELLELMLEQSKRIDALKEENERLREELDSKKIMIENSGSLAEAALRLSGVFEAAQKAADLYLENIKNGTGGDRTETPQAKEDQPDKPDGDKN